MSWQFAIDAHRRLVRQQASDGPGQRLLLPRHKHAAGDQPRNQTWKYFSLQSLVEIRENEMPAMNDVKWPLGHLTTNILEMKVDRLLIHRVDLVEISR